MGEVYYRQISNNEIEAFRVIDAAHSGIVWLKDMERDRIASVIGSPDVDGGLRCIAPKYKLTITYRGRTVSPRKRKFEVKLERLTHFVKQGKNVFSPFTILDAFPDELFENSRPDSIKGGEPVVECMLYGWETFETLKQLFLQMPFKKEVLKAHKYPIPKRATDVFFYQIRSTQNMFKIAPHMSRPAQDEYDNASLQDRYKMMTTWWSQRKETNKCEDFVDTKMIDMISIILAAINKDMNILVLYNTCFNKKTSDFRNMEFGDKYNELNAYVDGIVSSAYAIEYNIAVDIDNIQQDHLLVRFANPNHITRSGYGKVFVVPYVTESLTDNVENSTDPEDQETLEFLEMSRHGFVNK